MRLTAGGVTYLDGRDLTPTDFYRMLKGMKRPPVTSGPSPAGYLDVFRSAAREATDVLCLTVSSRFSSSYNAAKTAVLEAEKVLPGTRVSVLDSQVAAGSQALISLEAWRTARSGAGLDETIAVAKSLIPRVSLLAYLDTLYFLWKGGRVPGLVYAGTSLLRIKPLFELTHEKIKNLARPRTAQRAAERLVNLMRHRTGDTLVHATVMHADAPEAAERLKERVASEFRCEGLYISEFSPVMGAHTGPGLVGIAFWSETPLIQR